ncbi:ATP-dependent DNA helicase DinG [Alysiella filiformis]|uniref:ATP-dependent DNA helicase DinG n=1 Tax=Alysiella filiformis DSM 16848 TaxID=1120981 RepID=A0A286E211_9NEIS|nr:ATP-dependent DNA helicase DinG [Alysiella filiformis]QMT32516.1 ATP-dependent DNA helicase DinG [Alysiella filiformis]UBQ57397.1 ATP-dependent DNA helicase DinG [Alysiella filiformis DSM 16848]SOD64922.1 ATP-dependent DNA helicase DinG [Alysiella filiformis DSM 16848]
MLTDLEKNAIRDHYRTLSDNLPQFRPRPAQREMIAAIANAFSRTLSRQEGDENPPDRQGESIAVIEGPTGVGKSLAYLLAGGIMAQTRGKRLIVSSATIALQEQLVGRDLPFVVEKSGLEMSFALAKGRGRYLCLYKLYQLTQSHAQQTLLGFEPAPSVLWDSKPQQSDLDTLTDMAKQFANRQFNGDRDTWSEKIDDNLWFKVTNDRHGCLKNACPNRPECPFFLARDVLDTVDVVVANHDLLLADISMGGGVILPAPEQSFYCIDEAHHLPKKALNQFAAEHSWLQAIWTMEKFPTQSQKILTFLHDKWELANLANEAAASLLDCLNEWQFHLYDSPELNQESEREHEAIWLWEDGIIPPDLATLVHNTHVSASSLLKHINALNDALGQARRDKNQDNAQLDAFSSEFGGFVARAEQIAAVWEQMATVAANEKEPPLAKWISRRFDDKNVDFTFHASPISSAAMLASGLWRKAAGAVLTSATLQSLGNFNLLLQQTGLHWLPETTTLALQSPFNFAQQGELYIPPLSASPKDPIAHTDEVVKWLPKLIDDKAAIGTLVLFTSRKQMNDVAFRLPENLLPHILVQGEQSKAKILEQHYANLQEGKPSIIFGLDSFAEGLDLPHEACVHVIIVKLPFSMPDNPIEKTQSRWIEKRGGKPFMEITVPEASIKLIQAVGRLIRTENDYGRITILDNRIKTQRYGQQMLACLPPFKRLG